MSIYPNDGNSPATFTRSRSHVPNRNPRHGPSPRPGAFSPRSPTAGSSHREETEPPLDWNDGSAVVAGCIDESTSDLTEFRRGFTGRSCGLVNGIGVQDNSFEGNDAASNRSDHKNAVLHCGKRTGGVRSLRPHCSTAGINIHGNALQSGARKNQMVSANHLLNFHYDPIQRSQPRLPLPRKPRKIRPFNRDLFLQANYRFIVLDTGNYFIESMDPDKMLDWDDIVCVSYSTPSSVECPICLQPPLCPQITSCGHIYCFSCILRYLLMGEEDHKGDCWKKCPLCFMAISSKDLYAVTISHVRQYEVGDDVNFSLLTRRKNSFIASRKNFHGEEAIADSLEFFDTFSKFVLTSDVELSVREAKSCLTEWLAKADAGLVDDLERLPYVCAALEHVEQRAKIWAERRQARCSFSGIHSEGNEARASSLTNLAHENAFSTGNKERIKSCKNQDEMLVNADWKKPVETENNINGMEGQQGSRNIDYLTESIEKISISLCTPNEGKNLKSMEKGKDAVDWNEYFFYQVSDGQHIILHPLNMKCLLHHYKSYDLLPSKINGKILQLETVTQSEAVRRRFRFLSHFSLTTTFQLCEIDLRHMLPSDAFSPCIEEIKKRERERRQTAKKERQAKAVAEGTTLVANHVPFYSQTFYSQTSFSDASFSLDDFEALGNSVVPSSSPPVTGERKLFSDVTRLGFASAHDSPSLSMEDPVDPPAMEGLDHGPSISTLSFASIISTTKPLEIPEPRLSGFGKKGKKPTRVLLSTAGGRRY